MTVCSFGEHFKIETTTIFNMLDLENLLQKNLGLPAVNKTSTDPLDAPALFQRVSAKAKYILALYCHLAVELEEHYNRPSTRS